MKRAIYSTGLAAAVLFCAVVLSGCATTALTCLPQPKPPEGAITQRDVGLYLVDVAAAGQDCRQKLLATNRARGLLP